MKIKIISSNYYFDFNYNKYMRKTNSFFLIFFFILQTHIHILYTLLKDEYAQIQIYTNICTKYIII